MILFAIVASKNVKFLIEFFYIFQLAESLTDMINLVLILVALNYRILALCRVIHVEEDCVFWLLVKDFASIIFHLDFVTANSW